MCFIVSQRLLDFRRDDENGWTGKFGDRVTRSGVPPACTTHPPNPSHTAVQSICLSHIIHRCAIHCVKHNTVDTGIEARDADSWLLLFAPPALLANFWLATVLACFAARTKRETEARSLSYALSVAARTRKRVLTRGRQQRRARSAVCCAAAAAAALRADAWCADGRPAQRCPLF